MQTPTASQQEVLKPIQDGLIYSEPEASFLARSPFRRADLIFEYNQTPPSHAERRRELLEPILGSVGERTILLPFSTLVRRPGDQRVV